MKWSAFTSSRVCQCPQPLRGFVALPEQEMELSSTPVSALDCRSSQDAGSVTWTKLSALCNTSCMLL